MKWTRSFKKQDGALRLQFSSWKVPVGILERGKLCDGDSCRVAISVGEFGHAGSYILTSGGEFRVPRLVRDELATLCKSDPNANIEFNLFEGKGVGDEDVEFERRVLESRKMTSEERRKRLEAAPKIPKRRKTTVWEFIRNPDVVAEVLERAGGVCEVCANHAPFVRASNQTPYLEVHHKRKLADGGLDTVRNAVALCPNCHRRFHYGPVQTSNE